MAVVVPIWKCWGTRCIGQRRVGFAGKSEQFAPFRRQRDLWPRTKTLRGCTGGKKSAKRRREQACWARLSQCSREKILHNRRSDRFRRIAVCGHASIFRPKFRGRLLFCRCACWKRTCSLGSRAVNARTCTKRGSWSEAEEGGVSPKSSTPLSSSPLLPPHLSSPPPLSDALLCDGRRAFSFSSSPSWRRRPLGRVPAQPRRGNRSLPQSYDAT